MGRFVRCALVSLTVIGIVGGVGCQGVGVRAVEIPDQPIAITYRDPELARKRAESLQEDSARPESELGIARVDDITRFVTSFFGVRGGLVPVDPYAGVLALLDPRTGRLRPVASALRGAVPLAWNSDYSRLLFTQPAAGRLQVFELDIESGNVQQITRGPEAHPRACYGPDGRFVVMAAATSRRGTEVRILITEPGGGGGVPLSLAPAAYSPACAPDGSAVAWIEPREGGIETLVVRSPVLSGAPRAVAPGREPTFSPDGQWIAYSAPLRGEWKLWRVRPDGRGRAPIGKGMNREQGPAISPDGRLVVYVSELAHRQRLYLRRFDGTGDRILFADGDGANPVW
jgi:Tol biopolymer transport system component